jgi:hypothetical protein
MHDSRDAAYRTYEFPGPIPHGFELTASAEIPFHRNRKVIQSLKGSIVHGNPM